MLPIPGERPAGPPAAQPDARAKPASKGGEAAPPKAGKAPAWPGIDDDPSMENEDGSGDWCGTGVGRGAGTLGLGWSGPDADGIWRRTAPKRQIRVDGEGWREVKRLRGLARKEKDPLERAAIEKEIARLARVRSSMALGGSETVQYGTERGDVFYTSKRDESLPAFLQRVKNEVAERAAAKAKVKSAREPKDASK